MLFPAPLTVGLVSLAQKEEGSTQGCPAKPEALSHACFCSGGPVRRFAVASPPAAAQELTVLLAEFAQPIWEVFKIEDVSVESFKVSLD